jgi:hypothetical protein
VCPPFNCSVTLNNHSHDVGHPPSDSSVEQAKPGRDICDKVATITWGCMFGEEIEYTDSGCSMSNEPFTARGKRLSEFNAVMLFTIELAH